MAFEDQVSATWQEAFDALIDNLTSLNGWAINADYRDTVDEGGYYGHVELQTPNYADHDERMAFLSSYYDSGASSGSNWAENGSDGFQWGYGKGEFIQSTTDNNEYTANESNWWLDASVGGQHNDKNPGLSSAQDAGQYWMYYTESGFVWYWERTEDSGGNSAVWCAYQDVNPYFDYMADEADQTLMAGCVGGDPLSYYQTAPDFSLETYSPQDQDGYMGTGWGMVNQASENDDFVTMPFVLYGATYEHLDNNTQMPIGEVDHWLRDKSGTGLSHGDVIQDSGGTNRWMILREGTGNPICIKMS
ncbi:hypothetical protein [Natrinema versiforme]|uniref:Uncharacterized protein n=1 Tax=Natrinema versiforme JCM 10478 TaxID=1227496 RepID=L9YBK3_9EURY|nr:hypothetical protein [Natrinema versiforme]ELY71092.1 hypothetical protein C489_02021 [Natrinema versiforme JCM 10478]